MRLLNFDELDAVSGGADEPELNPTADRYQPLYLSLNGEIMGARVDFSMIDATGGFMFSQEEHDLQRRADALADLHITTLDNIVKFFIGAAGLKGVAGGTVVVASDNVLNNNNFLLDARNWLSEFYYYEVVANKAGIYYQPN